MAHRAVLCALVSALLMAGCGAPTAFAVAAFGVDAIGTSVGLYQRWQDRKVQIRQNEELAQLRREVERLRHVMERTEGPP